MALSHSNARTTVQIMDEYAALRRLAYENHETAGCANLLAEVLALAVEAPDNPLAQSIIAIIVPDETSNG